MPEIVQWIYHQSAVTDPLPCGEVCERLTKAQEETGTLGTQTAEQIDHELGEIEQGLGTWPSLSELVGDLSGGVTLGKAPLRIGWHIGSGSGAKWVELKGPSAPNQPCTGGSGHWEARLKLAGEQVATSGVENVTAPTNSWYLVGCIYLGEIVHRSDAGGKNPECSFSVGPEAIGGWTSQSWIWNACEEEPPSHLNESHVYATADHASVAFSSPQPWTGQHLEGEDTFNLSTASATDPGEAAVTATAEGALEHVGQLGTWLEWVLHGELGPNPAHASASEGFGEENSAMPGRKYCLVGEPVNCSSGNQIETQEDLTVAGRGPRLELRRTYNSQLARAESSPGPFGYGWTSSYSAHLSVNEETGVLTVFEDNGSTVRFVRSGAGWTPLSSLVQATLVKEGSEFLFTVPDQTRLRFDSAGRLASETDRNGNALTMTRGGTGRLEAITDASGRKITLAYNGEGRVESAKDPLGHVVKYSYESGDLASVTLPGESSPRWQFKYDSSHELTTETNGRGGAVTTKYDGYGRVTEQKDALGRTRKWEYTGSEAAPETTITEPNASTTVEKFNILGEPTSVTRAAGTAIAVMTQDLYDSAGNLVAAIDANGHITTYQYDEAGDLTAEEDPDGDATLRTYNAAHELESEKLPNGERTTIERDGNGNATKVSRPAPGGEAQITKYKYGAHGELESVEDPLKRMTEYEYDSYGDRTAEIDPEGDKRTWSYNVDSQETATVAPRGNVGGGEPLKFTTTIDRDAQGRPLVVTEPEPAGEGKPTNKTPATISGLVQEGQTLSANTGMWEGAPPLTYSYQWRRCDASGESCSTISGAASATHVLSRSDLGHALRVVVTATNSGGSTTSTSAASAVVAALLPVYSSQFASAGSGEGQLSSPRGIALDSSGHVWVADQENNRLEEFSEGGEYLKAVGSYGSGSGQLSEPRSVAIDSHDNVWVADTGDSRLEEFNEKGEYLKTVGSPGSGSGQFNGPKVVTVDSHDNVWVADTGNDRIEEFNEHGEYVKAFGSAGTAHGQFESPRGLAVGANGDIWVADTSNDRIQEFNESAEFIRAFGSYGSGNGQFNEPKGITIDSQGNVWVVDSENGRVQVFGEEGEYEYQFGVTGNGDGQFAEPWNLQFGANGAIFVSDTVNNRVERWLSANPELPSISGELIAGQTLVASTGPWSAQPPLSYAYQWQRCNSTGESCSAISGATSVTYHMTHGDVGHTLRVAVTAINRGGSATRTSAATEVVARARATEYTYDANGNVQSVTDANGHTTSYTYDAENEPTKVEQPSGTVTETEYDAMGQVTAQIDGDKHKTEYTRNLLGEVTEVSDPLGRKTKKTYDAAGNLAKLEDSLKRTTTYSYDAANRLTEVSYSDGVTPSVKYEYDADGDRTKMVDGTGTSKYAYDQLDRLIESKDGHGGVVGYEYDLDNEQTKITYPNTKSVTRAFDKDGRLESVTDWASRVTKFTYNRDSELTATVFPSGTGDEDKYAYDDADQMSEVKMLKGAESLASLTYVRDNDGQVESITSTGLPGAGSTANTYDASDRLTKGGSTSYEYDAANNPTKIGGGTYKYDAASELETGPSETYTYNEVGERTKAKPASGPATSYGYDQAGNLVSVERAKEGEVWEISDAYAYDGDGLRASETVSATTSYFAWDISGGLPLILNDGTSSFIYGPSGLPVEQINNTTGAVLYLHHDQQGSTRLLTGSTGTVTGKCTYSAYGTPTCEGTTTTPLGYDGQYTSADSGLVYLRNRVYDPATAQFLTVDPAVALTREPYAYGGDNPVNRRDPDGLSAEGLEGVPCYFPFCGPPPPAVEGVQHGVETIEHGTESAWNFITEKEGPNDEGEAELKEKEAQRECGEPNPGSLEKLKKREIERILDEEGTDIHTDKEETVGKEAGGSYDYYRDKSTGEIYLIPKDGGEPIPTGLGG